MVSNEKLIKWATTSLAGCDGGNIEKARVWIAGIEWGFQKATEEERILDYRTGLLKEINEESWKISSNYSFVSSNGHRFNQQFAKLYSVIQGHEIGDYQTAMKEFSDDEVFKVNLFPIAFRKDQAALWGHYKLNETFPQFPDKVAYQNWCRKYRFAHFAELVKKHRPEIILCTGISYASDFLKAFGGKDVHDFQDTIKDPSLKNTAARTYYYTQLENGTHLFVVPFLVNRNGLNSHCLIDQMGKIIKDKVYPEKKAA